MITHFNCQKQYYFKFGLALVQFHSQKLQFETIQFSISMQFRCHNSSISSRSV